MSAVSGLGCSAGGHFQGDACLFDEEGVALGDLLEIVGESADHLVVVLGQAGEEGQLAGEGAGGGAGGHGAARPGPGRGQGDARGAPSTGGERSVPRTHRGMPLAAGVRLSGTVKRRAHQARPGPWGHAGWRGSTAQGGSSRVRGVGLEAGQPRVEKVRCWSAYRRRASGAGKPGTCPACG